MKLEKNNRIYAYDKTSGEIVYRVPGAVYGDGQRDTEENPVWLKACDTTGVDIESLPTVVID